MQRLEPKDLRHVAPTLVSAGSGEFQVPRREPWPRRCVIHFAVGDGADHSDCRPQLYCRPVAPALLQFKQHAACVKAMLVKPNGPPVRLDCQVFFTGFLIGFT